MREVVMTGGRHYPAAVGERARRWNWGAMGIRRFPGLAVAVLAMIVAEPAAEGAKWSREYIRQLPDSAFASVETTSDGKKLRHLPHHDSQGDLDIPHLCSALARFSQVKWRDPANAESARRHLEDHLRQVGRKHCRPTPKSPGNAR